jgi:hypothetical protein
MPVRDDAPPLGVYHLSSRRVRIALELEEREIEPGILFFNIVRSI